MKNKKLLYILIPITLLVWGLIVYRIVGAMQGEETLSNFSPVVYTKPESENILDTFSISGNYPDPFLRKNLTHTTPVNNSQTQPQKNVPKQPTVQPIKNNPLSVLPKIAYLGIIKNQKQNKQIALIQINDNLNNMKLGDKIEGVELLKVFKDSIIVVFQKQKITVFK
jgi:hypothetical protein